LGIGRLFPFIFFHGVVEAVKHGRPPMVGACSLRYEAERSRQVARAMYELVFGAGRGAYFQFENTPDGGRPSRIIFLLFSSTYGPRTASARELF
jgi:hypothetical protein